MTYIMARLLTACVCRDAPHLSKPVLLLHEVKRPGQVYVPPPQHRDAHSPSRLQCALEKEFRGEQRKTANSIINGFCLVLLRSSWHSSESSPLYY